MRPLCRAEVRDVDRRAIADYGMSGLVLMENAGRGCVEVLRRLGCQGPVTIICGKGNNAGDGFVIARHLDLYHVPVKVVLVFPDQDLTGDAQANFKIIEKAGLPVSRLPQHFTAGQIDAELAGSDWIVDALLGTGASGEPRFPVDVAIRAINDAAARRLAVDLPSGLDCDTGRPSQATVRADHTCTFVAEKIGFGAAEAAEYLGQVHVVDIGVPRRLLDDISRPRPMR